MPRLPSSSKWQRAAETTVYVISILNFSLKGNKPGEVEHRSSLAWEEDHSEATDALNLIFIELPNHRKTDDPKATRLDKFCYFMRNMPQFVDKPDTEGDELLENLVDSADFTTLSESDKLKIKHDMTTERDIRNQIEYAREDGHRIGLLEGLEEGKAAGEKSGIEKGLQKGREEGRAEGSRNIATKLLALGIDINDIETATGISVEELQKMA